MRDKELGALIARLPLINAMKTEWPYNQQANAQLIASAPDLAAALTWIIARLERGGAAAKQDAIQQACAALAKAGVA